LAVTTETLLGVATPWMVVGVLGPVPVGPPPVGAEESVLFDLAQPANRAVMASRQATLWGFTRSFLDLMSDTFELRCG